MRIAIDIRSLIEPLPSGITTYTYNILRHLIRLDSPHEFVLIYNATKPIPTAALEGFRQANARIVERSIPNKLLNTSIALMGFPKFGWLTGTVDLFFLPNLNFFSLSHKTKLIVTMHDVSFRYSGFYSLKGKLWHCAIRPKQILQRADKIIAVSENTKADIQKTFGIPSETISVIPLGVDHDAFARCSKDDMDRVRNKYHIQQPFLLSIGTVEPRKNSEGIFQAWDALTKKQRSNHSLVIAGKITNQKLASRYPSVQFIGYIPEEDKIPLYKAAKAFVYPSYFEGFGLPVLEAMAAGLPVITSFATSLPEVARGAALLVDPYNTQELSTAIHNILTDNTLAQNLRERSQQTAKSFSWKRTAEATISLINSLA